MMTLRFNGLLVLSMLKRIPQAHELLCTVGIASYADIMLKALADTLDGAALAGRSC